ncbi:MAG TPA: hypothetical protein VD997_00920 [Phycisphaerales bacterium]|nr:hypothetical protein [Phycisphaerales bacterium]
MRLSPAIREMLEATALFLSYGAVVSLVGGFLFAAIAWSHRTSPLCIAWGMGLFIACVICRFTCNAILDRAEGQCIRRRDLCPSCGYDLRGLKRNAACPECGCGAGPRR